MTDQLATPSNSTLGPDTESDALAELGALRPEQLAAIRRLMRERDHLVVLHEAVREVERAPTLEARLRVIVEAIRRIGFGRVAITLRDASLAPTLIVTSGLTEDEDRQLREHPASGETWQRRFAALEPHRISESYYFDASNPKLAEQFHGGLPSRMERGGDPSWHPGDSLIVPIGGQRGRIIATLVLDDPADRSRPSLSRVRTVELFGQQVAHCIEQASLVDVARRRAERLQRLHETGAALSRSLEEEEIVRELARQAVRIVSADGVVVAHPHLDAGTVRTAIRVVRGLQRPRPVQPLGSGPIAEAARTGQPVRIGDYDPSRVALAAADDFVGDGGPAQSVLAVPMLQGSSLIGVLAVYSRERDAYTAEDEEVLLTVGAQAATAIANGRLYAESQTESRQIEALADVARAVGESLRMNEVLQLILRHAMALLHTLGGTVSLRDGDSLHIVAGAGDGERLLGMRLPVEASMSGRALRERVHLIANDVLQEQDAYPGTQRAADIHQVVIVPLITPTGAIGALSVFNRDTDFVEEDARILQRLADHVAVAIVNARLFEDVAAATREWTVAFDAIGSGMVVLDAHSRIQRCNARALDLIEARTPTHPIGRPFHEVLFGEMEDCGDCVHGRAIRDGVAYRGTHRSVPLGKIFEVRASPHPSGGAVVTFDDVTSHHALAERHRLVVETAGDAIVITDLDRRIAYANPAARDLLGTTTDLTGRPVGDFVPTEVAEKVKHHEDRAMAGERQRYEAVLRRADGERRIVAISTAPLREVGEVTGIVASLRDITDERRARDAVAQSEARYRNLFETATDAIYTLDAKGTFTSVNDATCRISGFDRETLLGRNTQVVMDPADVEGVKAEFRQALEGESRRYECHIIARGGDRRLLSVTNTPIRHGNRVIGVLGIARDVTDERGRALAREPSEARYTRLVESASDAIITVDDQACFTSVNYALEASVGRPRAELLGRPFTEVIDARDRDAMMELFRTTLTGQRQRGNFRYQGAAGELRAGGAITAPIQEQGRVVGVLGVVRDVTEEQRLTEQLLQQEKLAAIGQLVSGVAHELNNPLAGVMAFSQLLLSTPGTDPDLKSALETIHAESKRAARIVTNLLTFARQHPPERRDADLNQLLLDTLELRRFALRVQQIEVDVDLDESLPPTWADGYQLQQVFLNVLANAEQALDGWEGTRRITLRTERRGGMLVTTISDTGPGVPPQLADRIFNPFYTTKPVGQGTGLGLSISHGIVHEHGGRIELRASEGGGATFVIELPLTARVQTTDPPRAAPPLPASGTRTVLIVDDEPSIRIALSGYLSSLGHAVDAVGSGEDALDRLAERRYDAVLLDLRMPGISGDLVYQRIKEANPVQAARVVFITGDVQSEAANAFIRSTGRPFLSKPFLLDDVGRALFHELSSNAESSDHR